MTYTISNNPQFKSLEISFNGKPSEAVRDALKALRFRWHSVKKVWYGYSTEEAARAAIETAGQPLTIPPVKEVYPGTLYAGWEGGNNRKWNTEKELKAFILADLKKAGIPATIRFNKAGYITSLTLTVTISSADVRPFEDWKEHFHVKAGQWNYYTDETGKLCDIYGEQFYSLPSDDQQKMLENIARTTYNLEIKHLSNNNIYHSADVAALSESGQKKLETILAIMDSYNRDCSNSMVDYFDRSIYDHYSFKIA